MAQAEETDRPQIMSWLMDQWMAGLGRILESMTDARPVIRQKAEAEPMPQEAADPGEVLWWEQAFSLCTEPALWAGAPTAAWTALGARTLRAAGIDTADPADAKSTYLEILNQSLAALAQAVTGRAGREVVCAAGEERQVAPSLELCAVEVSYPDADPCMIYFAINPVFATLVAEQHAVLQPPDAEMAQGSEGVEARPFPDRLPARAPMALELLFDVELPVSVSFGHAHLPLKDVLKLNTGSIVELDRGIAEPVDIVINNCVIARGEVVVMDGNYGVRIQHIVSRGERLLAQRIPGPKRD